MKKYKELPRIKVTHCALKAPKDISEKLLISECKWGWECDHMLNVTPYQVMEYNRMDLMDEPDESYPGGTIASELNELSLLGVTGSIIVIFESGLEFVHWHIEKNCVFYKRVEMELDIDLESFDGHYIVK